MNNMKLFLLGISIVLLGLGCLENTYCVKQHPVLNPCYGKPGSNCTGPYVTDFCDEYSK